MHIRYLQSLWDIKRRYEEWIELYEEANEANQKSATQEEVVYFSQIRFKTLQKYFGTYEEMREEYEAIRYLANLRFDIVRNSAEGKAFKPTTTIITRALTRFLSYLEVVHHLQRNTKRTLYNKIAHKEMECCYHYLFQFSLHAWVDKLPKELPTFEEKYNKQRKDLENEPNIEIKL